MPMHIREATPADAAAIAQLNQANNDLRATVEHIAQHIALHSAFERAFLAEVDGVVAGMACLRLLPALCDPAPYAELTEVFVESAYRRQGVGRALIQHIEAYAKANGASHLVLLTAWKNTNAHAFYHELGFRLWCINMQRELDDTK